MQAPVCIREVYRLQSIEPYCPLIHRAINGNYIININGDTYRIMLCLKLYKRLNVTCAVSGAIESVPKFTA